MMFPFMKYAVKNLFSKPSTVEYPNKVTTVEAKPNYRGRIAYYPEKCVNCGMCIKVCAPTCIERTEEEVEEGTKVTFTFDLCSCTFCSTCSDFCSTKAIVLTDDYHMVAEKAEDLVVSGSYVKKKILGKLTLGEGCVYCTMCARQCPEGALTVDRKEKKWELDESKCVKCGICIEKCPKKCLSFEEPAEEVVTLDEDSCVYCTLCAKKCPAEAITVDRKEKVWAIDHDVCTKCGLCISACPKKALSMGPKE